ncbi:MAG: hypothetical protein WB492_03190, partial [Christiangramia sp.]
LKSPIFGEYLLMTFKKIVNLNFNIIDKVLKIIDKKHPSLCSDAFYHCIELWLYLKKVCRFSRTGKVQFIISCK